MPFHDKTSEIIKNYAVGGKNINLIIRDNKQGLDTAHKFAFKYAIEKNYKNLITLDADLSHDPNEIPKFIDKLNSNDFVIGSRYMQGGGSNMNGIFRTAFTAVFSEEISSFGFVKYIGSI